MGRQAAGSLGRVGGCFIPSRKPPGAVGSPGDASSVPVATGGDRQDHARSRLCGICVHTRTHASTRTRGRHGDGQQTAARDGYTHSRLHSQSTTSTHSSRPQITTASPGTLHGKRGWGSRPHSRSTGGCAVVWFIFRPNKSGADRHDETGTADSPGPCLAPSPAVSNAPMPRCFVQGTIPLARLTAEPRAPLATTHSHPPPPPPQQQQQWTGLDRCIGCRPGQTLPVRRAVRGKRRDDYREPRSKWSFAQLVLVGCDG